MQHWVYLKFINKMACPKTLSHRGGLETIGVTTGLYFLLTWQKSNLNRLTSAWGSIPFCRLKKRTSWVFLFTQSLHNLLFSLHFWSRWLHSVPCPQLHRCRPSDIPPAPLRSPEHLWPVATHKTHKENTHLEHKDTTLMAITVTDCSYCYHDHLIWKLLFILIYWLFILHKIYEDKDFFFFFAIYL